MSIVEDFQNILKNKYHSCSYVFYGKSDQYKAYGFATWSKNTDSFYKFNKIYPKPIDREKKVGGVQINSTTFKDYYNYYILPDPNVEGDGTVPFISGAAPKGKDGEMYSVFRNRSSRCL